ncbi:helix-turn-helix transcriptional regulator [Microbispora amethystogenes]|uniref:Helix-turn-helix transcriptional regulator n=1 Tax=Microbispora amethystogenes TaxID=1427754 RepID=A0ABQ4FCV5_9ACTN|nr:LuxR family transcriptional regulator [Microbispora amethystogenes]GIH32583.1 helix-turn-helix transcriptional regulator [Microbispora amethystogenes]
MSPDRRPGRGSTLVDREAERKILVELLNSVRGGESRTLVIRGDAGVGKTALLQYMTEQAASCRVVRVTGVQSEAELPFAGVHQLCLPLLNRLDRLPAPQREALRVAFGLTEGSVPDRFLVGLAVLSLLSEAAEVQPLVCLIDDQQWLDRASALALGFVARRLGADPVGIVFATRVAGDDTAGLPELHLTGLPDADARALLESELNGPLDTRVRDQILAETRGNPLALLELPRGLTRTQLAGGFGLPGVAPLTARIEDSFLRQLNALPSESRRLLQLAAADPSGDTLLVWRAAKRLGIETQTEALVLAGLAEFGARVSFRHPLLRSAAYRSASEHDRRAAHLALAEATDRTVDPDRRAWHLAQAATGPDESVAEDLEQSANRAQSRGGLTAAAAFLQRSALLTVDPARRAQRTLAAAQTHAQAGEFSMALELLATAQSGPLDELQSARIDLLYAEINFASGLGSDAPALLLRAAKRLEPLDAELARDTYLRAWMAAILAGRSATPVGLPEVSQAAQARKLPAHPPGQADLLLDALTLMVTQGPAAAAPKLRAVMDHFTAAGISVEDDLRWGWFAQATASALLAYDPWRTILERQVRTARDVGALDLLPVMLAALGTAIMWSGDFAAAELVKVEEEEVCAATGSPLASLTALALACMRGDQTKAVPLIEKTITEATTRGQGVSVAYANWTAAILYNGLGLHDDALAAATESSEDAPGQFVSLWALPELIEAAVRTGDTELARDALSRLSATARAGGADFGLGLEARCRALLSEGDIAEGFFLEAIERLARTPLRPELARARLLYGEWLHGQDRRADARGHVRTAFEMFTEMGMAAFAERARRELHATGARVHLRTVDAVGTLTAKEALIAELARDGRTNQEIGSQLFISARTVEWHLRKVFGKLGITSRKELDAAMAGERHMLPSA